MPSGNPFICYSVVHSFLSLCLPDPLPYDIFSETLSIRAHSGNPYIRYSLVNSILSLCLPDPFSFDILFRSAFYQYAFWDPFIYCSFVYSFPSLCRPDLFNLIFLLNPFLSVCLLGHHLFVIHLRIPFFHYTPFHLILFSETLSICMPSGTPFICYSFVNSFLSLSLQDPLSFDIFSETHSIQFFLCLCIQDHFSFDILFPKTLSIRMPSGTPLICYSFCEFLTFLVPPRLRFILYTFRKAFISVCLLGTHSFVIPLCIPFFSLCLPDPLPYDIFSETLSIRAHSGNPYIRYSLVNSILSLCLPDPFSFDILFRSAFYQYAFWDPFIYCSFTPFHLIFFSETHSIRIPSGIPFNCYSFVNSFLSICLPDPLSFDILLETFSIRRPSGIPFICYCFVNSFFPYTSQTPFHFIFFSETLSIRMPSGTPFICYSFVNFFLSLCLPDPLSFDILFGNPFYPYAFWDPIHLLFLCEFLFSLCLPDPLSFDIPFGNTFYSLSIRMPSGTTFIFYSFVNSFLSLCLPDALSLDILFGNTFYPYAFWDPIHLLFLCEFFTFLMPPRPPFI
ncbi:unnamed protein product [Acanthosepion pharaonis]|uniref:Uncharacterized protein n=1 Tax=Acanthosepion pharaonis TaxID=158019 RepID=A0A812C743_ACAPH|nr:unnamed protein product [Sepia pharaonis]